jgi:hypothetical protein
MKDLIFSNKLTQIICFLPKLASQTSSLLGHNLALATKDEG